VVVLEVELVGKRERGFRVPALGDRGRAVELDHGRAGGAGELAVELRDPRPVGRIVHVQRGDLRLERVRAAAAQRQRAIELSSPVRNLVRVPERPVLIAKQHDRAVREPSLPARVVEQHQREQRVRLGLVRHQLGERATERDRLRGQVAAPSIALVEDQVDDGEHRCEALREQVRRRNPERDPRGPDLVLRAHEPLRHRRLGDEERACDLVGRQPPERAQRQRDLSVERQGWMAASEQELEALIRDCV
jgi:hypothetical protein